MTLAVKLFLITDRIEELMLAAQESNGVKLLNKENAPRCYDKFEKLNNKNTYMLTNENAPKSYNVYFKYEHYLLLEVFERILHEQDIFFEMQSSEIEKIKTLILPALLDDNIIKKNLKGFICLKNNIVFDASYIDKIKIIKSYPDFFQHVCSNATEKNKEDHTIFNYISKKSPKNMVDKINLDLLKIQQRIKDLPSVDDEDSVDSYFSILVNSQSTQKINNRSS